MCVETVEGVFTCHKKESTECFLENGMNDFLMRSSWQRG